MKKDVLIDFIVVCLLWAVIGCGQRKHNAEKRTIAKERLLEESRTADLSEAVKATDLAGWDSSRAFKAFDDTVKMQITAHKAKLRNFKEKVRNGHKKVPVLYRGRIHRLENRIAEMEQRQLLHKHAGKEEWEDFTRLYHYDLTVLGRDIDKLVKNHTMKPLEDGSQVTFP
jgi:gas vesicle protein